MQILCYFLGNCMPYSNETYGIFVVIVWLLAGHETFHSSMLPKNLSVYHMFPLRDAPFWWVGVANCIICESFPTEEVRSSTEQFKSFKFCNFV